MAKFQLTTKQKEALLLLFDPTTKWLGWGGSAGGGKSYLGCYWIMICCQIWPGSKWAIGRDSLKDTRASVLQTWRKLAQEMNVTGWKFTIENKIIFENGSEVEFLDLSFKPAADPLYERFGSKEFTGIWLEECGNVNEMAFEVLKTRVGRWHNEKYKLIPKILLTFNPKKNWLYDDFYLPYKKGEQNENSVTKFIPALYSDNPHLPKEYIENLKNIKDNATRERLLNGNFEYDDDPTALMQYNDIAAIFTNSHIENRMYPNNQYITADVARYGSDRAIVLVWDGWVVIDYKIFDKCSVPILANCINMFRTKYNIPKHKCVADEDGIGGGVVDVCGIHGFLNGGKPKDPSYRNLKSECGYRLAEDITKIWFKADIGIEDKQRIIRELGEVKTWESDKDGKLKIQPKEVTKMNIKGSPDWGDNFLMREYFNLFNTAAADRIEHQISKYLL